MGATDARFDLVFCAGVLYHLSDPVAVVRDIARVTDRCFVWSHYIDEDTARRQQRLFDSVDVDGWKGTYFRSVYADRGKTMFLGGVKPENTWLSRDGLLSSFRHFGFGKIEIVAEDPNGANGAWICFAASR